MALSPGARLGPYAIVAPLGEGGMGEVYRARDTRLDRDVALKILPEAFTADPDRRARFEREAKAVAALSHPNILAIFDVGECDGVFYAATELLEGQTLRDRLSSGPLPTRKAIELAVQIARGLAAAHDRGIVHRDLKPENLFLVGDGQVKILDFGLARQAGPASGTGATETLAATDPGTVMGTLGYMAPEQARGQTLDGRADLFSLGAVLYEMVTGERAFVRATAADTMSAILREDPPDISGTRADIPPAFDRIIRHCLEKEPDERFQTARDVAFALSTLSGPTPSASGALPESAATRRFVSAPFTALPFIAVSLLAIVGLAGWIWSATRTPIANDPTTVRFALSTAPAQELTTAVGMNLTLSPDGNTLVYAAADSDGVTHLYRRTVDDLRQTMIAGTERAASPFFSYDGREVGFIVGNQLMRIPAAGGTASVLAEIERLGGVSFRGASWGPNGVIVSAASNLALVPSQGGEPGPLVASGAIRGFWPVVLAGGDTLLYSTLAIADGPLGAVNLRSGAMTELSVSGNVPLGVAGGDLIFARTDGRLYAIGFDAGTLRVTGSPRLIESEFARVPGSGEAKVAVSQNGTLAYVTGSGLVKVVESDLRGATRALPVRPGRLSFPRYAPDGRSFAADLSTSGRTDIYVYDLQSGAARRLTADGTLNERPEWSPGGDRLLYKTDRGGPRPSLWWLPADGSGTAEALMASPDKDIWQGMLSPDGKTVMYRTGGGGTGDIWSAPVGNGGGETAFATARFNELGPRFSPDGRAVAYYSDESGSYQVYVRPFPGPGAAIPVSVNGGQAPVWSRDGRTIYFANGRQFMAAAVDTAGALAVVDRKVLFEGSFLAGPGHAAYDIAPDGKSILMLIPESGEPETIVVVRNLAAELRQSATSRGAR